MQATLTLNTKLSVLILEIGKMTLSYRVPEQLKFINKIKDCNEGVIKIDTNYGDEYVDFIDLLETTQFDYTFVKRSIKIIKDLRLDDIELRGEYNDTIRLYRTRKNKKEIIEERAYLILNNKAFDYVRINGDLFLMVINMKNLKQRSFYRIHKGDFVYMRGNIDKRSIYKTLDVIKMNKNILITGFKQYDNIKS